MSAIELFTETNLGLYCACLPVITGRVLILVYIGSQLFTMYI